MLTQKNVTPPGAGEIDTDFGVDGVVIVEVPGASYSCVMGVLNGPGNCLYVCGSADIGTSSRFFITALTSNGVINPDFGNEGFVIDAFGIADEDSYGMQLIWTADEKLLLVGAAYIGINPFPALAKFDLKGNIDPEFGEDGRGKTVIELPGPPGKHFSSANHSEKKTNIKNNVARLKAGSSSLLDDGKILLSHYFFRGPAPSYGMIIRLLSNGTLDAGFNTNGYVTVVAPGYEDGQTQIANVTIDSTGSYLACGGVNRLDSSPLNSFFARYSSQGLLDESFGANGFQIIPHDDVLPGGGRAEVIIPLDVGGALGIGGSIYEPYVGQLLMLDGNGQMKHDFNSGAPLNISLDESGTLWKSGVVQPDGMLLVAGAIDKFIDSFNFDIVLARFDQSGSLDSSFNSGLGWARMRMGDDTAGAYTVLLQGSKIVVGGLSSSTGVVLRFQS